MPDPKPIKVPMGTKPSPAAIIELLEEAVELLKELVAKP